MSKAITEKRDDSPQALRWQTPAEAAPSAFEDQAPVVSRWVGALALALIVLGGVVLLMSAWGRSSFVPPWLAVLFVTVGLGGLLFHAANDAELQIRRVYMLLGLLLLALGAGLALLPMAIKASAAASMFLPWGLICFVLGLVFTAAFVRNETEAKARDLAVHIIGGCGAVMALTGFLGGTIDTKFLVPHGVLLILLGFAFLWAFIAMKGTADDRGHWAALGVGAVGLVFFLIALGRSALLPLLAYAKLTAPAAPYTMPAGLLLMTGGAFYLALSAGYCSDRQLVVLTRRELGALFYSPLAYMVLLGYVILGLFIFANFVVSSLWEMDLFTGKEGPAHATEPIVRDYIIGWFPIICVLMLVPVLTMRLFSEEHRTGTLEMTFTAPVEETVVVLSKFLAVLIFFMAAWVPWGLYLVSLRGYGKTAFDYMPVIGFAVMLLFSGASFLSMGLFFSSLTRNQLAAAVMTFVVMLALVLVFFAKRFFSSTGAMNAVLTHISFVDTWFTVLKGKLVPRDLVLYLSATVFWLFLAVKVLESRKWR
jgi:ABC-type transport system involved in multi-copper enzyme maturation permease subunit